MINPMQIMHMLRGGGDPMQMLMNMSQSNPQLRQVMQMTNGKTPAEMRGMVMDEARKRGAYVIALTSLQHTQAVTSRNRLNLRLFEAADLVLDNGGILGDASWQAADGAMVGPTTTAIGAAMLQSIVCRVKELSLEENFEADYFKSSNVDGGDEWNDRLIERYKDQIPGLL